MLIFLDGDACAAGVTWSGRFYRMKQDRSDESLSGFGISSRPTRSIDSYQSSEFEGSYFPLPTSFLVVWVDLPSTVVLLLLSAGTWRSRDYNHIIESSGSSEVPNRGVGI